MDLIKSIQFYYSTSRVISEVYSTKEPCNGIEITERASSEVVPNIILYLTRNTPTYLSINYLIKDYSELIHVWDEPYQLEIEEGEEYYLQSTQISGIDLKVKDVSKDKYAQSPIGFTEYNMECPEGVDKAFLKNSASYKYDIRVYGEGFDIKSRDSDIRAMAFVKSNKVEVVFY